MNLGGVRRLAYLDLRLGRQKFLLILSLLAFQPSRVRTNPLKGHSSRQGFIKLWFVAVLLYPTNQKTLREPFRLVIQILCPIGFLLKYIWVVVKMMVPFWIPIIIRHLIFRVPKKGP